MQFKLEELPYQQQAIAAVVRLFERQERNAFDNATDEGIRFNYLRISPEHLAANIYAVADANGISSKNLKAHAEPDFCIEMETGTGKTLVYLKTIFELYKEYGFAKFIILVPSVAIREGVLSSFATFADQLADLYGFRPDCFEYDSSRLHKVSTFIEAQHPQIMVMTLQSFNSEERILNQAPREVCFRLIRMADLGRRNLELI